MTINLRLVKYLIGVVILVNALGMCFPLLSSTFSQYYGSIAKTIVLTNNWTNLMLLGHDWLDKPHLPFWLTALSFKVFGINAFAYILPGFLFYLLGLLYTYRLAYYWYDSEVALVAVLITASSLHLMMSAIDVRAESYLIGTIMPASFYWLYYDRQSRLRYLVLAAFFTALALMTKGLFILITIISGPLTLWIYQRKWQNFISLKWISAFILCLILTAPELIALYMQFDSKPNVTAFGHTHVSGLRWFFWDSQFGRFFNTGPIMSTNPPKWHYLFFVHTFLWAYLPWWPVFFVAVYQKIKNFRENTREVHATLFLLGYFFITFVLFSVTTFQVDHYTNILFPTASIIGASYLCTILKNNQGTVLAKTEIGLGYLLVVLALVLAVITLDGVNRLLVGISLVLLLGVFIISNRWRLTERVFILPSIGITMVFLVLTLINGTGFIKYDAGYNLALYLNQNNLPVIGYNIDLLGLDFYSKNSYRYMDSLDGATNMLRPFYLVTKESNLPSIKQLFANLVVVKELDGSDISAYAQSFINKNNWSKDLVRYVILEIK